MMNYAQIFQNFSTFRKIVENDITNEWFRDPEEICRLLQGICRKLPKTKNRHNFIVANGSRKKHRASAQAHDVRADPAALARDGRAGRGRRPAGRSGRSTNHAIRR